MPSADPFNGPKDKATTAKPLKPFSISLSKGKTQPTAAKPFNPRKRPHSSLAEDESETEDATSKAQLVSAFDHSAGGAISVNGHEHEKGPLVIPGQKNRDWREESYRRKGKSLLPQEVQAIGPGEGRVDVTVEKHEAPPNFGLNVAKASEKDPTGDSLMVDAVGARNTNLRSREAPNEDDEAIEALLGNGAKKSTLILPTASDDSGRRDAWTQRGDEDDAFRSDLASRPDSASLADYVAVPVDEFGPAMLRGMAVGRKGPQAAGDKLDKGARPKELVRRPALLGLGAKETPDGAEELGAWGEAAKGKRKAQKNYNPVSLKNSVTGEVITEEELEKRKKDQAIEEQEWRERRHKNLALDTEEKGQKRLDGVDDGRGSSRLRRDRSRSPDQMAALLTREIEADPLDVGDTTPHGVTGVNLRIGPSTAPQGGIEATREIESAAIGMIVTNYTTMTAIEKAGVAEISITEGAYIILRARESAIRVEPRTTGCDMGCQGAEYK
ncbi:hypothetical protein G7Y79_00028g061510 [Physcia stellaris]|nr:hypothetical protein G7Y79_00028g061510 [Physcia stellaris]